MERVFGLESQLTQLNLSDGASVWFGVSLHGRGEHVACRATASTRQSLECSCPATLAQSPAELLQV